MKLVLFIIHSTCRLLLINGRGPRMLQHVPNTYSSLHIAIQHPSNKIDAVIAHHIRHSQVVIHDFIDTVERVLLVDDRIQ